MAYWKDVWEFKNSTEYEYKYAGQYGAKGEKREKKKKVTPDQIKKQNQKNREKKMRRLIKANFLPADLWCTLKYAEGIRKPVEEVKKDLRSFLADTRKEYKRRGEPLKFIYRMEIGKRGGIHIHILVNRLSKGHPDTDVLIQSLWNHGRVHYESIYELGGYQKLANYIVKAPDEEEHVQMNLFPEQEQKELIKYSSSRNLIRPQAERTEYRRWTVKDLVKNGPKPSPGYYIDKESIVSGVNQYTGMTYYQYTEVRKEEINSRSG